MKRTLAINTLFILSLVALVFAMPGNDRRDDTAAPPAVTPQASGYVVHVDPATGEFVDKGGTSLELDKSTWNNMNDSSEGLQEVPAPGGGMMVDLQGRFRHSTIAVLDENGNIKTMCSTGQPHTHEEDE